MHSRYRRAGGHSTWFNFELRNLDCVVCRPATIKHAVLFKTFWIGVSDLQTAVFTFAVHIGLADALRYFTPAGSFLSVYLLILPEQKAKCQAQSFATRRLEYQYKKLVVVRIRVRPRRLPSDVRFSAKKRNAIPLRSKQVTLPC